MLQINNIIETFSRACRNETEFFGIIPFAIATIVYF